MTTITISVRRDDVARWTESGRFGAAVRDSLRKAGGDAMRAVRTDTKRGVRRRKRVKARYLQNRALPIQFPRRTAPISELTWVMRVSGAGVPLGRYPARQTKKGVRVEVNRGKRVLLKGAFMATMKSGHKGVWMREGKKRLPIDHAMSSRVSDVAQDRGFAPDVLRRGHLVLSSSFVRLLKLSAR